MSGIRNVFLTCSSCVPNTWQILCVPCVPTHPLTGGGEHVNTYLPGGMISPSMCSKSGGSQMSSSSVPTATDSQGRKVVPHGEWEGLFKSANGKANPTAVLDFDSQTARNYIQFAKKHPEPITELSPARRARL